MKVSSENQMAVVKANHRHIVGITRKVKQVNHEAVRFVESFLSGNNEQLDQSGMMLAKLNVHLVQLMYNHECFKFAFIRPDVTFTIARQEVKDLN